MTDSQAGPTALHRNPFFVLTATPRDNRQRIVEIAEEKALVLDSDVCAKARADLTNPRNRLAIEVAWLPGLSPAKAFALVGGLQTRVAAVRTLTNAPALAHANLIAAAFELLDPGLSDSEWAEWILHLAKAVDAIDAEVVLRDVNEDRIAAGLPEVASLALVESELTKRRRYYKDTLRDALNRLDPMKLVEVMNRTLAVATQNGETHAPLLIDELTDTYEVETKKFLEGETQNIQRLLGAAKAAAKEGEPAVARVLDKLDLVVKKWDRVAQPIQLSMKSRGLDHQPSHELAYEIRALGLELHNEYEMLEPAKRLTALLQGVFAELPAVAERLDQDSQTIESLFEQREQAEQERQEWERDITYRTELGLIFKDVLAISPTGLQWKQLTFPLESITRVRWGAVRHSTNGVPTGTTYTICFGDQTRLAQVETSKEHVFQSFQSRLWKAVVVPLLTGMIRGLKQGQKYQFADMVVDDFGAEVTRHRMFGSNERVYGKWSELHVWTQNGAFYVGLLNDKKAYSGLSYLETDNAHLIETAIRAKFKNGKPRLSSILERSAD